jgi:hypothetical protein
VSNGEGAKCTFGGTITGPGRRGVGVTTLSSGASTLMEEAVGRYSPTLRSVLGSGLDEDSWSGMVTDVRTSVSCLRANTSVGGRWNPGGGLRRACWISVIPARTRSAVDANGMTILVGNQVMVLQMQAALLSHTHMQEHQ